MSIRLKFIHPETGPWKVSSQHFTAEVNFEEGVYWSGSIHWISYEKFNVYEMKRDYSEWFLKYEVDLSSLVTTFSEVISSYLNPMDLYFAWSILCLIRGEKDKDSFLVLQIPGKVIRYNLVYKTFETLHECAEVKDVLGFTWTDGSQHIDEEEVLSFTWTIGFQHIESLCCV
ncbi:F-box protein [Abeliophyllum distichum]|uniref:F-box protein n=1 Tax=Abeliophyllum distichum TaxID=126358 RepID=A0ABD1UQL2_9LAMI